VTCVSLVNAIAYPLTQMSLKCRNAVSCRIAVLSTELLVSSDNERQRNRKKSSSITPSFAALSFQHATNCRTTALRKKSYDHIASPGAVLQFCHGRFSLIGFPMVGARRFLDGLLSSRMNVVPVCSVSCAYVVFPSGFLFPCFNHLGWSSMTVVLFELRRNHLCAAPGFHLV